MIETRVRAGTSSLLGAALAFFVLACGGGGQKPAATAAKPSSSKPQVSSNALREFDRGLRALRVGGADMDEEAAERFKKAVELDGSLWEAWHNLGVIRLRRGDERGAIDAFSQALQRNPSHTASQLARAEAQRRLRKLDAARADYEKIIQTDPEDVAVRLRLASLLREKGDTDAAFKAVREVLRLRPTEPQANVELGLIYLAAGRIDLAKLVLSKAASADPKNPAVWNATALVSLREGRDQEGFQQLDHATQLDPKFTDARYNKASVLLDAGDYEQARAELEAALAGGSATDVEALLALGVAYRGLGKHDRAKATWLKVLATAPMNADALYNLTVLEMDFLRNEDEARAMLARYKDAASSSHVRWEDAERRGKELGPGTTQPAPTPAATAPGPGPAPKKGKGKGKAAPKGRQRQPRRRPTRHQGQRPRKPVRGLRRRSTRRRGTGRLAALSLVMVSFLSALSSTPSSVSAQTRRRQPPPARRNAPDPSPVRVDDGVSATESTTGPGGKVKEFDFTALGIEGKLLTPQLLYLLGRIKVELERATLEKRTFLPELVRSVDEGGL